MLMRAISGGVYIEHYKSANRYADKACDIYSY